MKTLVYDGVLQDVEGVKQRNPAATINGGLVFQSEFVKALAAYGTYDEYIFADNSRGAVNLAEGSKRDDLPKHFIFLNNLALQAHLVSRPDAILVSGYTMMTHLAGLRTALRKPHWPITGVTLSLHGPFLLEIVAASRLLLKEHDALICASPSAQQVIKSVMEVLDGMHVARGGPRLPIIPLAVSLCDERETAELRRNRRESLGCRDNTVVISSISRFSTKTKGDLLPLLLAIHRLIRFEEADVVLIVAGDDTQDRLADRLASVAKDLEISDRCRIMPNISLIEKKEILSASDIYVAVSDNVQESFGIGIVEAMSYGLPIIASDWNGYRDIVSGAGCGILVSTAIPAAFADLPVSEFIRPTPTYEILAQLTSINLSELEQALRALAINAQQRRKMGEHALSAVMAKYTWRKVIAEHESLWSELQERGKRQSSVVDVPYTYRAVFGGHPTAVLRVVQARTGKPFRTGHASVGQHPIVRGG